MEVTKLDEGPMDTIAQFGKKLTNWFQEKLGASNEDKAVLQHYHRELLVVLDSLQKINQELTQNRPILKTLSFSDLETYVDEPHRHALVELKSKLKDDIIHCYQLINEFIASGKTQNTNFEKFVSVYIRNGLSLTGISQYNPGKTNAYPDVNSQFELLTQSSQSVLDSGLKATQCLTQAIKKLESVAP